MQRKQRHWLFYGRYARTNRRWQLLSAWGISREGPGSFDLRPFQGTKGCGCPGYGKENQGRRAAGKSYPG